MKKTGAKFKLGVSDEYPIEFTSFDVFGTEVRVYDEKLCDAIKKLSERRRNVVLMFYFLESAGMIADI